VFPHFLQFVHGILTFLLAALALSLRFVSLFLLSGLFFLALGKA